MRFVKLGCSVSSSILLMVLASGCSTFSALDFSVPGSKSYAQELGARQNQAEIDRKNDRKKWHNSVKDSELFLSLEKAVSDDVLLIEVNQRNGEITGR